VHDCTQCNRYSTLDEKLACVKKKEKRMQAFPGYVSYATYIHNELRAPLAEAIMCGDWEEVARIWEERRWMVE
jgi:hypothetical protein